MQQRATARHRARSVSIGLLASSCIMLAAGSAVAAPRYEATITRTKFGMPHITARDFGGLGFGAAYAEAQDNFCLMAETYLNVSGERSKYYGADGTVAVGLFPVKNVDSDVFYHVVLDSRELEAAFAKSSPDARQMVNGWVEGYNRFLKDHHGELPAACANQPWVRPITRTDALRSMNAFSMFASTASLGGQIANAAPPTARGPAPTPKLTDLGLPGGTGLGSNGWAFGGDATSNGRGLVLANPHMPWAGPNRFYQKQLTIPGKFSVAGAGVTNHPFIGIGFNKDVAWTHTVDSAAHMMLFKLTLDPADPTSYMVDGRPEKMKRRELRLENRDGAPITRTVYSTRYGPMVSLANSPYAWTSQTAYAVRDANRANVRSTDTYLTMARARNVRELRAGLAKYLGAPFLTTMAADRDGDAMYADIAPAPNYNAARFRACGGAVSPPIPGQLQRLYTVDGSRSACNWRAAPGTAVPGLLPADQMATIYRRDFVQNSNDSYRWTNPAGGILELGPMMGVDPELAVSLRTRSALQEIAGVLKTNKFDIDLARAKMFENKSFGAQLALPGLLELCKRPAAPHDACAALAQWDGRMNLDSRGAILFQLFWAGVFRRTDIWRTPFDRGDIVNTPRDLIIEGATGDALLAALQTAAGTLKSTGLALNVPLGEAMYAAKDNERIPISGAFSGDVLNVTVARPTKGGFPVFHGASWVHSVTFDEKGPVAMGTLTYSISTDPNSPHFADQTREFSRKKLQPIPFSEAEIARDRIGEPLTIRQ